MGGAEVVEVGKVCGGREPFVGEPGKASSVWGTVVTLVHVVFLARGEGSHGTGWGWLTRGITQTR